MQRTKTTAVRSSGCGTPASASPTPESRVWARAVTTMPRATARTAFAASRPELSPRSPASRRRKRRTPRPALSPDAYRIPEMITVSTSWMMVLPTPPAFSAIQPATIFK